jgi:signal transduction histidine kinase
VERDVMSTDAHPSPANPKHEAGAAIVRAQADLERALEQLTRVPALDVHSIALAAHALSSFLRVTDAVVSLLLPALRGHPDRQVVVWLDGLSHATSLMSYTVNQLMNDSVGLPMTPRLEDVDLTRLVERACSYYRRGAEPVGIAIRFGADADVPLIRTDRVLLAAVLDSVLANAVKQSRPYTSVRVDVRAERDGAVCHVRDESAGLSRDELERVFVPAAPGASSSGYGLAVAKRFVDQLGGEITCRSASGKGTTISFWLPSRPAA